MMIAERVVGASCPPLVVASLRCGSGIPSDVVLAMVEAVAAAGANAIEVRACAAGFADPEITSETPLPWALVQLVLERARGLGLIAMVSVCDQTTVGLLEGVDVPCYALADSQVLDLSLVERVAGTGRPLMISTGTADVAELTEAVYVAREAGCNDLVLLKCVGSIASGSRDVDLLTLPHMRELFACEVGLSDGSGTIGPAAAAVALGAAVIVKPLTLERDRGMIESGSAVGPGELAALVGEVTLAFRALGKVAYGPTEGERNAVLRRRSLYVTRNLEVGDVLTTENVRSIRPGLGLAPKHLDLVIGRHVNQAVSRATPLSWAILS